MNKYKQGDKVIYDGMAAIVDSVSHIAGYPDRILYNLTAIGDSEMTCTAPEAECEDWNEEHDNTEALQQARRNSDAIMSTVDRLTDKFYGDE